jgi:hypothetical protein
MTYLSFIFQADRLILPAFSAGTISAASAAGEEFMKLPSFVVSFLGLFFLAHPAHANYCADLSKNKSITINHSGYERWLLWEYVKQFQDTASVAHGILTVDGTDFDFNKLKIGNLDCAKDPRTCIYKSNFSLKGGYIDESTVRARIRAGFPQSDIDETNTTCIEKLLDAFSDKVRVKYMANEPSTRDPRTGKTFEETWAQKNPDMIWYNLPERTKLLLGKNYEERTSEKEAEEKMADTDALIDDIVIGPQSSQAQ